MKKLYKVCTNKGNKRIWIEGNALLNAGLHSGMTFQKHISACQIILSFSDKKEFQLTHKISGNEKRPIIDLCGKYLNEFFGNAANYQAEFFDEFDGKTIIITKV